MSARLFYELSAMLPQTEISLISKQAWHSLAMCGTQFVVSVVTAQDGHHEITAEFERMLPKHDFARGEGLVADIGVTHRTTTDKESRLIVHALLIED